MNKEEVKEKVRVAISQSSFRDDIRKVSLFGSYASGTPRPDSDVDLLIEFTPAARLGFFEYFDIREDFEDSLGKKVDLATPDALSKYIRADVLEKAETLYEK